jgi:hypothetical protein
MIGYHCMLPLHHAACGMVQVCLEKQDLVKVNIKSSLHEPVGG